MAGSADARVEKTSPQRLLRSHLTLVLTLIPIVLSAMRFSAVANGDRATLVRQLSALDVKSTLLGTFVWLLPTAFGVRGGNVLDSLGVAPRGARTGRLNFWLAIVTTVMALVLSAFAPVNDLVNLLLCLLLIFYFRRPRQGEDRAWWKDNGGRCRRCGLEVHRPRTRRSRRLFGSSSRSSPGDFRPNRIRQLQGHMSLSPASTGWSKARPRCHQRRAPRQPAEVSGAASQRLSNTAAVAPDLYRSLEKQLSYGLDRLLDGFGRVRLIIPRIC
jgi:hypothetical protein